jgi:hypothetical protein
MYAWFVLGVVWVMNSTRCPACPGIWRLTVLVILTTFARLALAVVCFYSNFSAPRRVLLATGLKTQGVSEETLNALPTEQYAAPLGGNPLCEECCLDVAELHNECCAVCLVDYEQGDLLRSLPCNHRFHQTCIDTWLRQRCVCPLCMQDIHQVKDKIE